MSNWSRSMVLSTFAIPLGTQLGAAWGTAYLFDHL